MDRLMDYGATPLFAVMSIHRPARTHHGQQTQHRPPA